MRKENIEKLDWEEIILNINNPVWDGKEKRWRVLDGYKYIDKKYYISFTDDNVWEKFDKKELYLKEHKNG